MRIDHTDQILAILRERADWVSGQEISEQFGLSRTAIWKSIEKLRERGFQIRAVQNRGYLLEFEPDSLSDLRFHEKLAERSAVRWAGKNDEFFREIGSTNERAKQIAVQGAPHGTLVFADRQTAGKGRLGRVWENPAGTALAFSLIVRPNLMPASASMLTLVSALAQRKAILEVTGLDCKIKWPNDLVVDGRKLCGILTEMSADMDRINYVVIGNGVNVNNDFFPEPLDKTATSIRLATGHVIDRTELLAATMEAFEHYYDLFLQAKDMSLLLEEYENCLVNKDRMVAILSEEGEERGIATGINRRGELMVEKEDGTVRTVRYGEVSVRGVYGYV